MLLYLVRHAIAIPRGAPGISSDASRELTPEGIRRMRQNARALVQLDVVIEEVWTSPLIRARQTADLLAEELIPRPGAGRHRPGRA